VMIPVSKRWWFCSRIVSISGGELDDVYASQVPHVCAMRRELSLRALHTYIEQYSHRRHSHNSRVRENRTSRDHDNFAAEVGQLSIRLECLRHCD
jgi:hypothetical protein